MTQNFAQVRDRYVHSIPVDVVSLANDLGIEVYEKEFENKSISGYISHDNNGYFICVNKKHPATRKQFTIAHEIGHFVRHRELLDNGSLLPTLYKIGDGINVCIPRADFMSPEYRRLESEANRFAADLLMPQAEFIQKANECEDLTELAKAFKVSVGAASIRANNLGIEIF
ncbi:TPA: hypothetical protein CPT87_02880 [Candidatus Gastranaerophilales bacterium HUM_5]|jgi:Zn-dependent peptidase ImmA (M78 family)|nr:MAG TPA: hypothetical protein CPT99_00115 [Candidatus Gastranaerophilales bacterium HUM_4]DAA92186.1 MAG TPA: hypothetical protein CPT87_02880 [Candidatus Gastranaerophilales bacterium HUM_5]DAB13905.1 MAG TPA: hypothetical protein CPT97_09085 [Candidatus Gastranaerophilales bacterium HUM_17]DAB17817.1 MAG TPA: hypothetical protein CPT98_05260 [Candidatus Gastranaerophilales bacterium HUM_19]